MQELDRLIQSLDRAVAGPDIWQVTQEVKRELERFSAHAGECLPRHMLEPTAGSYARRLLHRAADQAYTAVLMTWGPNQKTELHDHAGIWCVECVVQGELYVTQYDLVAEDGNRCRFSEVKTVRATVGDAGCLIPPFEYHVLANALSDAPTATLHIYGGEMDHCNCYQPSASGWYERCAKHLSYTT